MTTKTLWHCTPAINIQSILEFGIDPHYADNRTNKKVWLCTWYSLLWALAHTSNRHNVPVSQLAVFRVRTDAKNFKHFRGNIYTCERVLRTRIYLDGGHVLSKIEAQQTILRSRVTTVRYEPVAQPEIVSDLDWLIPR